MKIVIILISTFLPWAAIDLNLLRRRGDSYASDATEISLELGGDELHQKKKVQQHRLNVIPPWHRGLKRPVRSRCNYFSTKSRDPRDSDQRKIRRRINNV